MGKRKATLTLGYEDNPTASIYPGHVTATEFNKAYRAEGWHGDWVAKADLTHEYWQKNKNGSWKRSAQGRKGAVPVTVMDW